MHCASGPVSYDCPMHAQHITLDEPAVATYAASELTLQTVHLLIAAGVSAVD